MELLCQRNCLTCLIHQIFGILKQGKITFGLVVNNIVSQRTVCQDNKQSVILTCELMTTGLKIKSIAQKQHHYVMLSVPVECLPSTYVIVPLHFLINTLCLCLLFKILFGLLPELMILKQLFLSISNDAYLPFLFLS